MPLIATVTISDVSKGLKSVLVTANLTVASSGVTVIDRDFSAHFRPGIDVSLKVDIQDVLVAKMQKAIDEYRESDTVAQDPRVKRLKRNIESSLTV